MESKPKYTAIVKVVGIFMVLIGIIGLIVLQDAERGTLSVCQTVYMASILCGGICNLLDSGKGPFSILACISYMISAFSSAIIALILLGGAIYFVLWIIAISISFMRYNSITKSKKNSPTEKDSKHSATPHHHAAAQPSAPKPAPRSVTMSRIDKMDGHDFEHFTAELLKKLGYEGVEVTPSSGDQGVDVIAVKDGKKYAIQCKRYGQKLGNKPVQEVHAGKTIYGCSVAVVLTNNYFTEGGKEAARALGVELWDRDKLERMLTYAAHMAGRSTC